MPPEDEETAEIQLLALAEPAPIEATKPLLGTCRLVLGQSFGDDDDFGYIDWILEVDGQSLLVYDALSPPLLKVVDRPSGTVIRSFGERGEGPGELQAPVASYMVAGAPGVVAVYDFPNQRISLFELAGRAAPTLQREIPFRGGLGFLGIAPYGSGYVGAGRFGDFIIAVVDENGRTTDRIATPPLFGPDDVGGSASFAALMNDVRMAGGPEGNVALAYREESVLDLVDLEAGTYRRVLGPRPVETHVDIRDGRLYAEDTNELAYLDVTANDRLIFASFSGRPRIERARPGAEPRIVHVFDWEGRYVAELELDQGITTIEVSSDNRWLWAGYTDPYPRVGEWHLPPGMGNADSNPGWSCS